MIDDFDNTMNDALRRRRVSVMRRRSTLAVDTLDDTAFHVLNRGVAGTQIFRSSIDHAEFLNCFRRYLDPARETDSSRRPYRKLHDSVGLFAYALMMNHFHLVVLQKCGGGLPALMHPAMTGYSRCFNDRHERRGPLFESRYSARPAETDFDLRFMIVYLHLNDPIRQLEHEWTSHRLYIGDQSSSWVDIERGLALFGGINGYVRFMDRQGPRIVSRKLAKIGLLDPDFAYRPILTSPGSTPPRRNRPNAQSRIAGKSTTSRIA